MTPIACTTSGQCTVSTQPICDPTAHKCRACASSADAGPSAECSGTRPLCSSTGACVECLSNADCIGAGMSCNVPTGTCVPCVMNTDCSSGLCNAGTCADPSTLLYVNNAANARCSDSGAGTLMQPFCTVKKGLDASAQAGGKQLIVLAGTYAENVSIAPPAATTYVSRAIGVGQPTIAPATAGAAVTLDKSNGATQITVTLDGFIIKGAGGTSGHGILCGGSSTNTAATKLTLLRSTVMGNAQNGLSASNCDVTLDQDVIGPSNAQGGIYLNGSDFTLQNLLVYKNGTPDPGGSNFGGIDVASVATRKTIYDLTVVKNKAAAAATASGIVCPVSQPLIVDTVVFLNGGPASEINGLACKPDHSSFFGASLGGMGTNNYELSTCATDGSQLFKNPATDDYHAKPGGSAPCSLVGIGTSSGAPAYDLDGTTRPSAPSIGCLEPK